MTVGEICNREVIIVNRDENVLTASKLMSQYHVGDVVVTEERDGLRVPIGILTDRDIVVKVLACDLDPLHLTVSDVMRAGVETVDEHADLISTIELMRDAAIRRLPVLDSNGSLVGIITMDDVIDLLGEMLKDLALIISREQRREINS